MRPPRFVLSPASAALCWWARSLQAGAEPACGERPGARLPSGGAGGQGPAGGFRLHAFAVRSPLCFWCLLRLPPLPPCGSLLTLRLRRPPPPLGSPHTDSHTPTAATPGGTSGRGFSRDRRHRKQYLLSAFLFCTRDTRRRHGNKPHPVYPCRITVSTLSSRTINSFSKNTRRQSPSGGGMWGEREQLLSPTHSSGLCRCG